MAVVDDEGRRYLCAGAVTKYAERAASISHLLVLVIPKAPSNAARRRFARFSVRWRGDAAAHSGNEAVEGRAKAKVEVDGPYRGDRTRS